jgi:hypothetical protein
MVFRRCRMINMQRGRDELRPAPHIMIRQEDGVRNPDRAALGSPYSFSHTSLIERFEPVGIWT